MDHLGYTVDGCEITTKRIVESPYKQWDVGTTYQLVQAFATTGGWGHLP